MNKLVGHIMLAATLAITGCSNFHDQDISSDMKVRVAGGMALTAESRAPYIGTISTANPFTALVLTSRSATDFMSTGTLLQNGAGPMTFKGQQASYTLAGAQQYAVPYDGSTPAYYPPETSTQLYMFGLYPSDFTWTATTATHIITGKHDVMSAPIVQTSKADAIATPTTYRNLAFTHRMALLDVQVIAATSAAATAWGSIKYMSISKVYGIEGGAAGVAPAGYASIDIATNQASFVNPSSTFFVWSPSDVAYSGDITVTPLPITTSLQTAGYSIVQPVTIANAGDTGYAIFIRTDKNNTGLEVPISISSAGSTEGQRITVTITFTAASIPQPPGQMTLTSRTTAMPWIAPPLPEMGL